MRNHHFAITHTPLHLSTGSKISKSSKWHTHDETLGCVLDELNDHIPHQQSGHKTRSHKTLIVVISPK